MSEKKTKDEKIIDFIQAYLENRQSDSSSSPFSKINNKWVLTEPFQTQDYVKDKTGINITPFYNNRQLLVDTSVYFSDGVDGDLTVSTPTTLTGDKFYDNLTINAGVTLNLGSFRLFVKNTLTNNGSIINNGNNGSNGSNGSGITGGAGGSGGTAISSGSLPGGIAGESGGSGGQGSGSGGTGGNGYNGSTGSNGTNVIKMLGAGGVSGATGANGGACLSFTGGSGANGGTPGIGSGVIYNQPNSFFSAYYLVDFFPSTTTFGISASSGGSGGGGGGANAYNGSGVIPAGGGGGGGGGSGSNGGICWISAKNIVNSGTISANGGNGGNGGNGANATSGNGSSSGGGGGSGGSGGSGGTIILIYASLINNGTISVSGGSGGTKGTKGNGSGNDGQTGVDGVNGTTGNTGNKIEINVTTQGGTSGSSEEGGSGSITRHNSLSGLDYASSGHTGFEATLTKGNLTAGSSKITIGGTGTGAVIGFGVSIDVNQSNLNHGSIGGLSDDDHSQYLLLAGRSGGQTIIGGTGTTDDLILRATAGVGTTGSDIIFQVGNNGGTEAMRIIDTGDVGIGVNTLNAKFTIKQKDLSSYLYRYLKPDGTDLLYGNWDGGNFHNYLGGNIYYNIGANGIFFSGNNLGGYVALNSGAYLEINAHNTALIRCGTSQYATALIPYTIAKPLSFTTFAWNGSNGYSISSLCTIKQTQLSTTDGDCRLDIYDDNGAKSLLSIKSLTGNIGIGTTTPDQKLCIYGTGVVYSKVESGTNTGAAAFQAKNDAGTTIEFGRWGSTRTAYGVIDVDNAYMYGNGGLAFGADGANGILKFGTGVGIVEKMRILTNGKIGMNWTAPDTVLGVLGLDADSGAPSLTDRTKGIVSFKTPVATSGVQLNIGGYTSSAYAMWLQASYSGTNGAYPIVLNPLGGNVGIGLNNPAYTFDIYGTGNITGNFSVREGSCYIVYDSASASQFQIFGKTDNNKQLLIGYDTTNNTGEIQSIWQSTAYTSLLLNPLGGNVGIGLDSPTARLHLPAGTATANTAPLQLTSGVSETVSRAGCVEMTNDDLFFTITTGAARKAFILDDGTRLTSGRIPYAYTNGRLIDSANLTYDGTTLTFGDSNNIAVNTTNGTKIGTSTSQKLGFFNATPVVQQSATIDLGTVLSNLGFRASGTAYPITTSGNVTLTGASNNIALPYLMQSDSTNQAISVINTPQVLTFDTNVYSSGITRTSSSRFTIPNAGTYLITFSGIADLTVGTNKHIEIWLRVNGSDITGSNTRVEIPATSIEMTVAASFIQTFTANQYFELWTAGDSTNCRWLATAAGSTAGNVACPSLIITCNKISN